MKVLSLGWGVQSFTLAAMSALGEIEMIDVAIHADTTFEALWTYEIANKWTPWLIEHSVNVVTVQQNNPDPLNVRGGIDIPAYTDTEGGGMIRRQCTHEWKRKPIRKFIQEKRNGKPVELWLGISLDEFQRMKSSDVKYITHRWPLIDMKMTRKDCVKWLESHNLEVPRKSACTFCPYHNTAEWRMIKATPEDWKEAVDVDRAIRKARPPYDLFVHPSRKPLEEVDFRTMQEKGQLELWDNECSGICGV